MIHEFQSFVKDTPVAAFAAKSLLARIPNAKEWTSKKKDLTPGSIFYIRRGSSILFFKVPKEKPVGCSIVAAHSDSPTFAVGPKCTSTPNALYTKLSCEKYGGMLMATWMDRPLSVAGTISIKEEKGTRLVPVSLDEDLVIIPSVAIHMNRSANENASYNPAVDMQPLYGDEKAPSLLSYISKKLGLEESSIVSTQLFLVNRQTVTTLGASKEFLCGPRLDDLMCVYGALDGFLRAEPQDHVAVLFVPDHEEVGSSTYEGAGSDFLKTSLECIFEAYGFGAQERFAILQSSCVLSADNAHAQHPNHPEYADTEHAPHMNGGIVIKYNANRRYLTDASCDALFRLVCEKKQIPVQEYRNKPNIAGGSTLGAISCEQVSIRTVDIGLAQLAMHSSYETAGAKDLEYLSQASEAFFNASYKFQDDGSILGFKL